MGTFVNTSTHQCEICPDDHYSTGGAAVCTECPDGYRTNAGPIRVSCTPCPTGKYEDIWSAREEEDGPLAFEKRCVSCPPEGSASCDSGILKINAGGQGDKFWAPPLSMYEWDDATLTWTDGPAAGLAKQPLDAGMDVFGCLGLGLGCTNASGNATAPPAFACAPGYSGALCAVCDAGRFFKQGECVLCKANTTVHEKVDDVSTSVVSSAIGSLGLVLLAAYAIKRKAKD